MKIQLTEPDLATIREALLAADMASAVGYVQQSKGVSQIDATECVDVVASLFGGMVQRFGSSVGVTALSLEKKSDVVRLAEAVWSDNGNREYVADISTLQGNKLAMGDTVTLRDSSKVSRRSFTPAYSRDADHELTHWHLTTGGDRYVIIND